MRVRIVFIILLVAAIAAVIAIASQSGNRGGQGRKIVSAFYPVAYAAQQIGGKSVDVENLTPPGAEPHDLEVSPGDVRDLRGASLVLLLGHGFQPQLERAARGNRHVVTLLDTRGLDRFPNGDPHVWLDPLRYAKLVARIGQVLRNSAA